MLSAATLIAGVAAPAQAYVTDGLYLYMDARVSESYDSGNPGQWNDISVNGRNGTIYGSVTKDNATNSLFFDGTASGTNYVDLDGAFDDWGDGLTIEFIGEFGANLNNWERIFDFGNGDASDNIWVGRLYGTQNLTIEIWNDSTNSGRCHTVNNELDTRTLQHWIITMDSTPTCRIYLNGTEVQTQLQDGGGNEVSSPALGGTAYPSLPRTIARADNFVGRSNWPDPDLEGSIQMIRIYTRALSPDEVDDADSMAAQEGGSGGGTDGGNSDSGSNELAATGFDVTSAAWGALFLLAAGVVIIRRRLAGS